MESLPGDSLRAVAGPVATSSQLRSYRLDLLGFFRF